MNSSSARLQALTAPALTFGAGFLLGLWAYWPTLAKVAEKWSTDPQYTHGFLVPLFALALLALRRQQLEEVTWQPNPWGLAIVLAGCGMRLAAARFYLEWLDGYSILLCLAGLVVLAGGWKALGWSWPAIAFLVFMLPLPYRVEHGLSQPLRSVATSASTYALQTLGYPALAEGNLIRVGRGEPLNVAEACSGLSMLLVFGALGMAVALLMERPLLDRLIVLASTIPIAIIANVARVTTAGVLQELVGGDIAHGFHDSIVAAVLMMGLGLGLLLLEVWLLSRLLVPREDAKPLGLFRFARRAEIEAKALPAGGAKIPAKSKTNVPSPLRLKRRL